MLIDAFEQLTTGRLVAQIDFANRQLVCPPTGMKVGFADEPELVDAWICYDETGIWLASNAYHAGAGGVQGFEEPLSAVRRVVFADCHFARQLVRHPTSGRRGLNRQGRRCLNWISADL